MLFVWIIRFLLGFVVFVTIVSTENRTGALVSVDASSTVGVKYDDLPPDSWDLAKALLNTKDDHYWRTLAVQQFKHTTVRGQKSMYFFVFTHERVKGVL
jgi:hypothetical protein